MYSHLQNGQIQTESSDVCSVSCAYARTAFLAQAGPELVL